MEQDIIGQAAVGDIEGELHPAVDGQCLSEVNCIPCQAPGVLASVPGLAGLVSLYRDLVRWEV